MYSINQHFKTSTSLIIQNIINIEPVYTGPENFFNGLRSLHESAFRLHGTHETVQIFRRQINNIAICNKRCPVPCKRISPVRKFGRSKICTDQCKRGPIFACKLLSYSVLKQELFVDIKQAGKHRIGVTKKFTYLWFALVLVTVFESLNLFSLVKNKALE